VGRYEQKHRGGVLRVSALFMAVLTKSLFNSLKPSGHYMYHQFNTQLHVTISSAHTEYLFVSRGSEKKQRLFHCTELTGWIV
jgi:hypothetical protein